MMCYLTMCRCAHDLLFLLRVVDLLTSVTSKHIFLANSSYFWGKPGEHLGIHMLFVLQQWVEYGGVHLESFGVHCEIAAICRGWKVWLLSVIIPFPLEAISVPHLGPFHPMNRARYNWTKGYWAAPARKVALCWFSMEYSCTVWNTLQYGIHKKSGIVNSIQCTQPCRITEYAHIKLTTT